MIKACKITLTFREVKIMLIGCCAPIEKYDLVCQSGFDYVEFPAWQVETLTREKMDSLKGKIRKAGVPCIRLNSYCRGIPAIAGDKCDDEKTISYAESLMKKASGLGVRYVGVGCPSARRLPENYDLELADRQCEQFLRLSGEIAGSFGITLLLEALQPGFCNYINRLDQALDMIRRTCMDSVRMMADLYHMEMEGESWDILPGYAGYIKHMHVSTALRDNGRGLYSEADQPDCDRAFAAIRKCGYDDTVSIEPDAEKLTLPAMQTAAKVMRRSAGEK